MDAFAIDTAARHLQKKKDVHDKVKNFLEQRKNDETLNESNQILDNEQNVVVDLDKDYSDWWKEWGDDYENDAEDLKVIDTLLDQHYVKKAKSLETQPGVNRESITSAISKFQGGEINLTEFKGMLSVYEREKDAADDELAAAVTEGGKRLRKRRHTHKRHVSRTVGRRRTRGKTRHSRRRTRSRAHRSRAHRSAAHRSKARHNRRRTRSAAHRSKAPRKRNRGKNTRKRN